MRQDVLPLEVLPGMNRMGSLGAPKLLNGSVLDQLGTRARDRTPEASHSTLKTTPCPTPSPPL